ncbi:FAD-dependent pyridine nucleotide-disulfide oxidoreductase OS=Tsukamurella paurometabola (strain ATCC 8368 / DSM / CCUG 35730 / CIP 100753 / JCM 10117 /KCTC 9821 / NBRC 16120 / NCIMB 702349 / NCTC 13040) OX=521096 GN=Tpau_0398 PE=3 SV=1 [Tsukamurella paurometabola]|uniref:FAD-dependent pyridine nucleotide-disulfide oxidoreductase n=1 Tax=Tsukamurella paurometabola (strain ATCC 8368 / DSM 20162 / CCUG 35730 / CIP 100753 / JCM 10117 / KCTC 9821 / NBRC 16120 / NCIMB 702349 / NCTC 13040) TaxID=521096 RepID=D5URI6_TSUPD|nr:FAD-dependent oxidoreductase [Tsukamurella paurometabola]ADG77039.1 FAD-dependent pyridine nucleotide-disulfide oxidoreductase [Tsukamurella paurometabola DSM 20162]SUP42561.1 NADH dehydrogenase-like protein yjlD [Tsukamurella paurometabola]
MKVVVIGAGYAGTIAANRLMKKAGGADVTVVNPRGEFVERVRLHEYIAGSGSATTPLADMLNPAIRLVVGSVETIGDGSVTLADGTVLPFDHLVYAAGGAITAPAGTVAVGGFESAGRARTALAALPDGALVTVVGGGLTGIETAAEIAESWPALRVRLLSEGEIGASLGVGARRRVHRELERLGVQLRRGRYEEPDGAGLVLWAIATQVSDLAARSGLAVDDSGRVLVDEFLRSVSDPRIVAVGDGAAVPDARLSCQTALPQGAHGADNLARIIAGAEPKRFSMGYTGQNVSIGRRSAVIQTARRDDTPTRIWFGGRPAAFVKEQVCTMARGAARTANYAWLPAPK